MSCFLRAEWRSLVAVNYQVAPAVLERFLPAGVELDTFEGRCFVSLIAFRFLNTSVWGFPIPLHRNFDEINLRFYVRRHVGTEIRRGVTFIKELVPRRAIAFVARALYNENYVAVPMRSALELTPARGSLFYSWQEANNDYSVQASVSGGLQQLTAGTEQEFIFEHYWGYTRQRDGSTVEYQVEHPPWRVWERIDGVTVACDFGSVYGEDFASLTDAVPHSVMVAEGSPVSVYFPRSFRT